MHFLWWWVLVSVRLWVAMLVAWQAISTATQTIAPDASADAVSDLADQTIGLPAEFRADLLLRLLEAGKVPKRWKQGRLVEEILSAAAQVKEPYRRTYRGRDSEARAVRQKVAYDLRLDALSTRLRVVQYLMSTDLNAARIVFDETMVPAPAAAQCGELLEPLVDDYYETCARLATRLWASRQVKERDAAERLVARAAQPSSVLAIAPALRMISEIRAPGDAVPRLVAALAGSMDLIPLRRPDAVLLTDDTPLVKGVDTVDKQFPRAGWGAAMKRLRKRAATLEACESTSASPERLPPPDRFSGLLQRLIARRRGGPEAGQGWEEDADAFLHRLSDFGLGLESCPLCAFHQRAVMYAVATDFIPAGPYQQKAFSEWLSFLEQASAQAVSPVEWLSQFELLLRLARVPDPDTKAKIRELERRGMMLSMLPSDSADHIRERMRVSRDAVVATYARAEELIPVPYTLPPEVAAK